MVMGDWGREPREWVDGVREPQRGGDDGNPVRRALAIVNLTNFRTLGPAVEYSPDDRHEATMHHPAMTPPLLTAGLPGVGGRVRDEEIGLKWRVLAEGRRAVLNPQTETQATLRPLVEAIVLRRRDVRHRRQVLLEVLAAA